jgi:hypothetical protein
VILFNALKSIHRQQVPSFLSAINIGDAQGEILGFMKPLDNKS